MPGGEVLGRGARFSVFGVGSVEVEFGWLSGLTRNIWLDFGMSMAMIF